MDNLFLKFHIYELLRRQFAIVEVTGANSRWVQKRGSTGVIPFREIVLLDNKQFPEILEVIWQNQFSQPAIF